MDNFVYKPSQCSVAVFSTYASTLVNINKLSKVLGIVNSVYFQNEDDFINSLDVKTFNFLIVSLGTVKLEINNIINKVNYPQRYLREFDKISDMRISNSLMNFIIVNDTKNDVCLEKNNLPKSQGLCFFSNELINSFDLYRIMEEGMFHKFNKKFSPKDQYILNSVGL